MFLRRQDGGAVRGRPSPTQARPALPPASLLARPSLPRADWATASAAVARGAGRAAGAGQGRRGGPGHRSAPQGLPVLALQPGLAAHPFHGGGEPRPGKQDRRKKRPLRGSQPPRGTCLSLARQRRDPASTFARRTPRPEPAPLYALPACPQASSPYPGTLSPAPALRGAVGFPRPLTIFGAAPP